MANDARTLLMAAPVGRTLLPVDPAYDAIIGLGEGDFLALAARFPESPLVWALLAEASLSAHSLQTNLSAYAFARTGYHRGLDALRRAGWRGKGPIPWEHEPNQGFLRALWALACAAWRIGEQSEYERCVTFLLEASEEGYLELVRERPLSI